MLGHAGRAVTGAAVVRIVRGVDFATVAVSAIAIPVAVRERALAGGDDTAAAIAAARRRPCDHAGPAAVGVAAIVGIRARDAAPFAGFLIGGAAFVWAALRSALGMTATTLTEVAVTPGAVAPPFF